MELQSHCDLCGGSLFVQIHQQHLPTRNITGESIDIELTDVMCRKCGLIFHNPQPTNEEIAMFYSQNATTSTTDIPKFDQTSEHRNDTSESYKNIKKNQYLYFKERLGAPGRMLEVGCFEGLFLSFFAQDGWNTCGVEPGVRSSQIAREQHGIHVKNEMLRPDLWKEPFDAIMMIHVLEHVKSPLETLKILRSMLREDGTFCVEVPNILTFPENNLSPFFNYEHLYYFSPRSLSNVFAAAGYEVLEISDKFDAPIIRAVARPSHPTTYQNAFDEFPIIEAKIQRQSQHIKNLRKRVEHIVSTAGTKRIVIYGAGIHTELLYQLTPLEKMNIVGIVDIEKHGTVFGHQIRPISDIPDLRPDIIIISSYAYQEEIYKNLQHYEPNIKIEKLYEYVFELENMKV